MFPFLYFLELVSRDLYRVSGTWRDSGIDTISSTYTSINASLSDDETDEFRVVSRRTDGQTYWRTPRQTRPIDRCTDTQTDKTTDKQLWHEFHLRRDVMAWYVELITEGKSLGSHVIHRTVFIIYRSAITYILPLSYGTCVRACVWRCLEPLCLTVCCEHDTNFKAVLYLTSGVRASLCAVS